MTRSPTTLIPLSADADQRLQAAIAAWQSGDLSRTEAVAKSVLRTHPQHETAHLLVARSQRALGFNKQALQSCRAALQLLPHSAALLIEQALAQRASGRQSDAEQSYRQALQREPHNASAMHNLANLLQSRGAWDEAEALYQAAISHAPRLAQAHFELGNVRAARHDGPGARQAWQHALLIQPGLAQAWIKLGTHLQDDMPAAAIEALQRGLNSDPNDHDALALLGKLLCDTGRAAEAEQCAQMALSMAPHLPMAHYVLGLAWRLQGKLDAAIAPLASAAKLATDQALICEATYLQALCFLDRGLISQATPHADKLLALSATPEQMGMAHHVMGALLFDSGRTREARAHFSRAVTASPNNLQHRISYCATSLYDDDADGLAQKALCIQHIATITNGALKQAGFSLSATSTGPSERIRLGLLSSDFRLHSCAFFLEPLLTHIDQSRFELFAYDTGSRQDTFMHRFQQAIPQWRHVEKLSTQDLARVIAQDQLHALVDLAGLTDGGRVEALAAQAAPVQITWLGYLGTTGHPAVQYRLTDHHVDGPAQVGLSTETPIKLPRPYVCYQPPDDAPEVSTLPMLANGRITFASFNALTKLSDACVKLWSAVLNAVPDARLLIKTKALGDDAVREHTLQRFVNQGIAPERIELMAWANTIGSHLTLYHHVDVALDTTPYNGVTTTCEALWMGVPVVNLVGQTFSSRQGLSLLNSVGLPELATPSQARFVQQCVALARKPEALAELRASLRARMAASALTDGAGFARAFERGVEHAIHLSGLVGRGHSTN